MLEPPLGTKVIYCLFSSRSDHRKEMSVWKGVTYDSKGKLVSCLFCNICERREPATIVKSNEKFVAFETIAPASNYHILIAPRQHFANFYSLRGEKDAVFVEEMVQFGREVLKDQADGAKYCFHIPPFNSIDHLHLHCIANPQSMSWISTLKYLPQTWWCFSASDAIRMIRNTPPLAPTEEDS